MISILGKIVDVVDSVIYHISGMIGLGSFYLALIVLVIVGICYIVDVISNASDNHKENKK